jgi:hypothetical protein
MDSGENRLGVPPPMKILWMVRTRSGAALEVGHQRVEIAARHDGGASCHQLPPVRPISCELKSQ